MVTETQAMLYIVIILSFVGIWADESDGEDQAKPAFRTKQPKSYSMPIGFVAGGVQQAGKKNESNTDKKESDESEDEGPSTSFKLKNSSSDSETETLPRSGKFLY